MCTVASGTASATTRFHFASAPTMSQIVNATSCVPPNARRRSRSPSHNAPIPARHTQRRAPPAGIAVNQSRSLTRLTRDTPGGSWRLQGAAEQPCPSVAAIDGPMPVYVKIGGRAPRAARRFRGRRRRCVGREEGGEATAPSRSRASAAGARSDCARGLPRRRSVPLPMHTARHSRPADR